MKKQLLLIAAVMLAMLTACGGQTTPKNTPGEVTACGEQSTPKNTPGEVTIDYLNYTYDFNFDGVIGLVDIPESQIDQTKQDLIAAEPMLAEIVEASGGIQEIEITKEVISEDGKTAAVVAQITFGNGNVQDMPANLVLVDDSWKISQ